MRWSHRAVLVASLLLLAASPRLEAQRVAERHGFWFGGGIGMGSARLSCSICRAGRDGGMSGYLRLGATITPQLLIGGETTVWYHTASSVDYLLGSVQAVLYLYPAKRSGFYLKTGLGMAQYSAKDSADKLSTQALAAQVGVGYEVAIGTSMSIVPYANLLATSAADLRFNSTVSSLSAKTSLLQIGVGITLH
jgi:hypothetical protein